MDISDRMVRPPLCQDRSITALICSSRNRTEPDTGNSHLLACSSVNYRGRNAAHIHLLFDDVTYNIDQTLELTVMSVVCSIVILYAKYLVKMLHMVGHRNKQCSETRPKWQCSGPEQYQYPFQYYLYWIFWTAEFVFRVLQWNFEYWVTKSVSKTTYKL